MADHRFGGLWTADKLGVLSEYLRFYTQALKAKSFELVYIDAFAGTGRCVIRAGDESGETTIDGSAKIALDCNPPFHRYHFIERRRAFAKDLETLVAAHPNGKRVTLARQSAADLLPVVLRQHNWKNTRGVLFLDPYGLQCTWPMIESIAATNALDVFFLVSLSGLYRQAAVDAKGIDEGKARRLTTFLGTDGWRTALYTEHQGSLFDEPTITRARGYEGILQFTTKRLRAAFPYVAEPKLLGHSNGAPLFALYFAVANPNKRALELATKVSTTIFSKLR